MKQNSGPPFSGAPDEIWMVRHQSLTEFNANVFMFSLHVAGVSFCRGCWGGGGHRFHNEACVMYFHIFSQDSKCTSRNLSQKFLKTTSTGSRVTKKKKQMSKRPKGKKTQCKSLERNIVKEQTFYQPCGQIAHVNLSMKKKKSQMNKDRLKCRWTCMSEFLPFVLHS